MRKLFLAPLLCLVAMPLLAHHGDNNCCWRDRFSVVLRNAYFYPQSDVLRKIFHRGGHSGGGYWVEGDVRCKVWEGCGNLVVEASGSYFQHRGKPIITPCPTTPLVQPVCEERTKVQIPTFGLGLKYFWSIINERCHHRLTDCSLFIGGGMRAFFYREFDNSPYVRRHVKKNTVGGMVDAGVQMEFCDRWLLELFFEYNIKTLKTKCEKNNNNCNDKCNKLDCCFTPTLPNTSCPSARCDLNIGGPVFGIGLGYQF